MVVELDYTKCTGPIKRNGRWPPAGGAVRVILIRKQSGVDLDFPVGADAWTWELLISRSQYGGTPDLTLTATSVTVSGNVATLLFYATSAQTATITTTTNARYWVQVKSTNGVIYGYYATGRAEVQSPVGEG